MDTRDGPRVEVLRSTRGNESQPPFAALQPAKSGLFGFRSKSFVSVLFLKEKRFSAYVFDVLCSIPAAQSDGFAEVQNYLVWKFNSMITFYSEADLDRRKRF